MNKDIKELISEFSLEELEELGNFVQEARNVRRRENEHKAFEKFKKAFFEFRKVSPYFEAYVNVEDGYGENVEIDVMEALEDYMRRNNFVKD